MNVTRKVHQADALDWLRAQPSFVGCSIITSLPDFSEFPQLTLQEWREWFRAAAELIFARCDDDGVAIFYQSDIKLEGEWVDKGYLVQSAAERVGRHLLAHKIVCRGRPGSVRFARPSYSHLLCFSKNVRVDVAKSFMDVVPDAGPSLWARGMGQTACELACKMVKGYTRSHTVLDPFCGYGSVLAVANQMGLHAMGVDLSPKCVRKAAKLRVEDFGA